MKKAKILVVAKNLQQAHDIFDKIEAVSVSFSTEENFFINSSSSFHDIVIFMGEFKDLPFFVKNILTILPRPLPVIAHLLPSVDKETELISGVVRMHELPSAEWRKILSQVSIDESFEKIPTIDVNRIQTQFQGMNDVFSTTLTHFRKSYQELLVKMQEAVNRQDHASLGVYAHTMKGMCSYFFACKAQGYALTLQLMAQKGVLASSEEIMEKLKDELSAVDAELNKVAI